MKRTPRSTAATRVNRPLAAVGLALAGALAIAPTVPAAPAPAADRSWPTHGGSPLGDRYSPLAQIDRRTVDRLSQAWRVDLEAGDLQCSPLMVGRTLYGYTPTRQVIALDAATGARRWIFDSGVASRQPARGLAFWQVGAERRLFVTGAYKYLYALDPETGRPIAGFGQGGRVDVAAALGDGAPPIALTSPPAIFGDLVIIGFRTSETAGAAPGAIQAFDARTGALRWIFHTLPRDGEFGADTWPAGGRARQGGANAWAGMAVDTARGIVFAPTGSATPDFVGRDRPGDNLFANSLVALDAATGRRLWHFQGVRHDLFDRDFASPPTLVTVRRGGRAIEAVAQPSKQGFLFLFERATGRPLFPIQDAPAPASDVPGETAAPRQPAARTPKPFARQRFTEDMLTRRTPEAHAAALATFRDLRHDGPFTPMALSRATLVFPGMDGGAEWGGAAIDRPRGVLYINSNDVPWLGRLGRAAPEAADGGGRRLYEQQCAACHGLNLEGAPPTFPALRNATPWLPEAQLSAIVRDGRGRMPGFPGLTAGQMSALIGYLRSPVAAAGSSSAPTPDGGYVFAGSRKFVDPDGYPAVAPPWGTLSAIDLNTGAYLWRRPLGVYPALAAQGLADTGTENYGGPLVTAGGLLFIGATIYDRRFRAFDARSGRPLWQTELPYAGVATPITYALDGRQYVVIATSGNRDPAGPQGAAYVAFALAPAAPTARP